MEVVRFALAGAEFAARPEAFVPDWWHGEEEAAASTLAAMRAIGSRKRSGG